MTFQLKSWHSLFLASFFLFGACTSKRIDGSEDPSSPAKGTVQLAIWAEYISKDVLEAFEKKTGIKVSLSTYASNEELLAKLQAGATGFDLALPSDYMVKILSSLQLLIEIDRSKIEHFGKLHPALLGKPFDPENRYSIPYGWGTTGIAVRRDLFKGKITGWKDLLTSGDTKGFTLLDDSREAIGAALKARGYSLNSRKPEEIQAAKALLLQARPRVKAFTSEVISGLISGDLTIAQVYSVDALQARARSGGKVDYILPVEGGTFWIDHFVIPKGGKNPKAAHALIDFLTSPQSVASFVMKRFAGPVMEEAKTFFTPDFSLPGQIATTQLPFKKFELIEDLGEDTLAWDRAWTEIKAGAE